MKKKWIIIIVVLIVIIAATAGNSEKKAIVDSKGENQKDKTIVNTSDGKNDAVTVEERILVEQDGIKITAVEYIKDSIWGDGIKLNIENNSGTDYTIGCSALIVNDYMITDLFVSEVAAGKKANETMHLSSNALDAAGIDNVGKIEIYFHAYDKNMNYIFKDLYTEIKTSDYNKMDTTATNSGVELYNKDGIKIIGQTVDENSFWGTAILLYLENNTDKKVNITVEDMSINGYMINPYFYSEIYPGKKAVDSITVFESTMEENNITSIDTVELKFKIINADTYKEIDNTGIIKFNAE